MEIEKIYMKMEEEDMRSYLEQTVSNFTRWSSRNSHLKLWTQMGRNFKWYVIFEFFTIYRKILKILKNFENFEKFWKFWKFLPPFYSFGLFWTNLMM